MGRVPAGGALVLTALRDVGNVESRSDSYMKNTSVQNKMATLLKRIDTLRINTSLVIHHLKRLSPCGKLCLSDCSSYSTESAASKMEEFSLRYLEGKHEGFYIYLNQFTIFCTDPWI